MDLEENTKKDPNGSELMQVENEVLNHKESIYPSESPMPQNLMNALQLTSAACSSENAETSKVCEMRVGLPTDDDIVTSVINCEEEKEIKIFDCSSAKDEKLNSPILPIMADGSNLYYITFDENGEQYTVLTLENSDEQNTKSVEVIECAESVEKPNCDEQKAIQSLDNTAQCSSAVVSNGTIPLMPACTGRPDEYSSAPDQLTNQQQQDHLSLTNHYSPMQFLPSQHVRFPARQDSRGCCNCNSKMFQPYCERPLMSSTPTRNTCPSRSSFSGYPSSCTPSCSSCSSINLNSGGEETTSSSDNCSLSLPRVPNNTPESNTSMSSMPPPNLPLTQSLFNVSNNASSDENVPIRMYRKSKMSHPAMCPKEMHNQKERYRRGRIKKACLMMRNTIPGLTEKTDKATVLESAVRYILYLKSNLGHDVDKGAQTVPASLLDSDISSMYVPDFDIFLRDSEVPSPSNIYAANSFFDVSDYSLLSMEDTYGPLNTSCSIHDSPDGISGHKLFELKPSNNNTMNSSNDSLKGGENASAAAVAMLQSFASNVCDVQIKKEPMEIYNDNSPHFNSDQQIKTENISINVEESSDNFETMESFVMEQLTKDIEVACGTLAISSDPKNWSTDDVRKWILWTLRQYDLPMIQLEYFHMNGATLCSLSEYDFRQRASVQCGDVLFAQLEIWKTAANFEQQQQLPPAPTPSPQPALVPVFKADDSFLDISILQWPAPRSVPSPMPSREGSMSPDNTLRVPQIVKTGGSSSSDYSSDSGFLSDDDTSEDGLETEKAPRQGSHSHIHLWQFLKELLMHPQKYGSCIRWLDRTKGVFKIEDSVRVARLWGKRKNRPAMNYDKLSRSIRQYYKKGIMKKTERSQRLVYQFCHPYCL